jgi:hypothetical protein
LAKNGVFGIDYLLFSIDYCGGIHDSACFFVLFVVQKSVQLTYDTKNDKSLEKREPATEIQTYRYSI